MARQQQQQGNQGGNQGQSQPDKPNATTNPPQGNQQPDKPQGGSQRQPEQPDTSPQGNQPPTTGNPGEGDGQPRRPEPKPLVGFKVRLADLPDRFFSIREAPTPEVAAAAYNRFFGIRGSKHQHRIAEVHDQGELATALAAQRERLENRQPERLNAKKRATNQR